MMLRGMLLFLIFAVSGANHVFAQTVISSPNTPTWNSSATDPLLDSGIAIGTMGVISPTSPFIPTPPYLGGFETDQVIKLFDTRNIAYPNPPATGRPIVTPDEYHHHNWDMGSMGNVYGIAIDNDRNFYVTASTQFGAGYFTGAGVVGFGAIGDGQTPDTAASDNNVQVLNSTTAAGAVYKVDAVTGNVSVLANLPQLAAPFTHENCENPGETLARNTGPALGNIVYDPIHEQLFVSNFEDGRIYRLSMTGVTLSTFDPFAPDNGAPGLAPDPKPYGMAINADGSKLYFGTLDLSNPLNPGLYSIDLDASGDFSGTEVDQNADLTNDLNFSQNVGGGFTLNPWTSYSDLSFTPRGELLIGVRTGCGSAAPNLATSHNHGGTFYKLIQDGTGLYNAPAPGTVGTDGNFPTHYIGDALGPDDGYGGVAVYDKGDGTFDYLATSADIGVEEGPHGFLVFPHDYTIGNNSTTYLIAQGASIPGLSTTNPPNGVSDYKGVFGDIEVLGAFLDWGDAPDSYNTDNIPPNPADITDIAGPAHILSDQNITIGSLADFEASGIPSASAVGDDNSGKAPDDEDGISVTPIFSVGQTPSFTIPISNPLGNPDVALYAWLDLNGNGSFNDPGEFVASSPIVASATPTNVVLNFPVVPASIVDDTTTFLRLRVTSDVLTATDFEGYASNGEVEDHAINFLSLLSIGNLVWMDNGSGVGGVANDGIKQASESGIGGVDLELYTVGEIPGVDTPVQTTTTAADGTYVFSGLQADTYFVHIPASEFTLGQPLFGTVSSLGQGAADNTSDDNVAEDGDDLESDGVSSLLYVLTADNEPTGEAGFVGTASSSSDDNNANFTVDFAFYQPVSIGSYVWEDVNLDGLQGPSVVEPPIAGAVIQLMVDSGGGTFVAARDTDNVLVPAATTLADGLYEFDNLPPGDYRVLVTPPIGYVASPVQDTAVNSDTTPADELDSNIATEPSPGVYQSATFTLSSLGEPVESDTAAGDIQDGAASSLSDTSGNMTVDFGFAASLSIGSYVWQDADGDGVQEVGETAIENASVTLLVDNGAGTFIPATDLNGLAVTNITTGVNGLYQFTNLPAGDYRVRVTPPAGFVPTLVQDTAANSDTTPADELDSNIASSPAPGVFESGTFTLSTLGEPIESDTATGDNQDGNGNPADRNGNMTVDFGFIAPLSLGSFIFNDADGDGVQDPAETGVNGASVVLLVDNGAGTFIPAQDLNAASITPITVGADGLYNFSNLPPGDYKIQVTPGADWVPTVNQVTANNDDTENDSNIAAEPSPGVYESGIFTLLSGTEPNEATGQDGDAQDGAPGSLLDLSGNMTVDMGFFVPVSIGSYVWEDVDLDGVQDLPADEPAIAGALVELFVDNGTGTFIAATDVDSVAVASVTTLADGLYEFDNLPPGDYQVRVTPPTGYVASPVQDTAANSDTTPADELDSNIATEPSPGVYQSATFTLISLGEPIESDTAAGDNQDGATNSNSDASGNMTVDFGFVAPLSIGSYVWQDADGDGVQEAGEPAIPNATVALLVDNGAGTFVPATDINGLAVANITTGANGLYQLTNLPAGDYRVRVTPPAGFVPTPVQDTVANSDTTPADELDSNIASSPAPAVFESGTFTLSTLGEPIESDTAVGDNQDGNGTPADRNGNMTVDFGFIAPLSLGSFIFNDADGDGVQDPAETGVNGASVALLVDNGAGTYVPAQDLNAAPVAPIVVGADGLYNFTNLPPGDYKIQVTPGADWVPTVNQVTAINDDTENDSNIAAEPSPGVYESGVFTLLSGAEPNEATSQDGDAQDGAAGGPLDLSGNMTVDMGFFVPVSIGSYVWEDLNVDGVQDAIEVGLPNASVALLVDNGSGSFVTATDVDSAAVVSQTTGADGLYEFDNLPPGDYRVRVTPPAGFEATPNQDTTANSDALAADELDSNIASEPVSGTFESATFSLVSLGEPNESDAADGDTQDGVAGSLSDLSGNMTVDFGFVAPMSLGSYVWQDADGDGVQDATEQGIANSTVALLVDNGTGTYVTATDITGAPVSNVVTGSTGVYEFDNLPPGDYRVQVTPPAGFVPSPIQNGADNADALAGDELDSNINLTAVGVPAGSYESGTFTLSSDDEPNESDAAAGDDQDGTAGGAGDLNGNNTIDFGFIVPMSIGSFVWNDSDGDGVQDSGEFGLQNASVALVVDNGSGTYVTALDLDGLPVAAINTAANGQYEFSNLPSGNYKVQVTPPAGFVPSLVQDSAANADGLASDELDSNVNLTATGLPAGTYESGIFTLSSGGEPTESTANNGDDQDGAAGSVDDLSGNMTVDFGFVTPVSIGSYVWEDINVDGVQDALEPGVANASITLLVDNGGGTFLAASDMNGAAVTAQLTAVDGLYEFDNLPPGDYRVRVTPPAGFVATPTQTTADNSDTVATDETDSNIATEPVAGTYESATFTLASLGEPVESDTANGDDQDGSSGSNADLSGNNTVDFGLVAPMSIGSFVWQDLDGDGVQDSGEPPLASAQVTLLVDNGAGSFVAAVDINGTPLAPITVAADGVYQFGNLPSGDYQVHVTPPAGYSPASVQNIVDNDDVPDDSNIAAEVTAGTYRSATFTLSTLNEPVETGDVYRGDAQDGFVGSAQDLNGNMTVDFAFVPPAALGNYVWLDLDMDGIQDANEDGLAGVEVILTPPVGVDVGAGPGNAISTVTGPNGGYLFSNLLPFVSANPAEGYVVMVNTGTLPSGLVQTYDEGAAGVVGPLDHTSNPIQLSPNQEHLTADFGYTVPNGSLGDTVWVDADDDGVQDPSEPGIAGVTVSLTPPPDIDLGAGLGVPITTTTNETGKYLFTGLPINETYIGNVDTATLPAGYTASASGLGDPDVRDGNSTDADNQTFVVINTQNQVILDADFGYLPPAEQNNSVGAIIWLDADSDGEGPVGVVGGTDIAEKVLPGVTVALIEDATNNVVATTVSDANGQYLFTGTPDGLYRVRVTDQRNVLAGLQQTYDADGLSSPNTSLVDLDSGSINALPVDDRNQDFGYVDSSSSIGTGVIGDTIFFDENDSGAADAGEGLEGVAVRLYGPGPDGDITTDADNVLLQTQFTDENGNYLFTGLDVSDTGLNPGTDYRVSVDTTTLPNGAAGWSNTVDPDTAGSGDSESITTLSLGAETDLDQGFGYIGDAGNSLSGTVWSDSNGDGTQTEPGTFEGVTIEIRDQTGNVVRTTRTDANGDYRVDNLPDGVFTVVVTDDANVLAGFEHTDSPNGSTDTSDQTSKDDTGYTVDLDSAGLIATPVSNSTGDFGYEPTVTNPISLGYFKAARADGSTTVLWSTQTEVANIGFKVYGQVDDDWVELTDALIESYGDSVQVQNYEMSLKTDARVFALSDIDVNGKETLHGPFLLGRAYGSIAPRQTIDWQAEKAEREAKRMKREAERKAQQRHRSEQRKLRREEAQPVSSRGSFKFSGNVIISRGQTLIKEFVSAGLMAVISSVVPSAYAQEPAEELVNLKTTETGIHTVSVANLLNEGVDLVGLPASDLALRNRGVSVPIFVSGGPILTQASTIQFVADAMDTLYTDVNVYTLSLDAAAARRMTLDQRQIPVGVAATSYLRQAKYAPQSKYAFTSPDSSDPFYAKRVSAIGKSNTERFDIVLKNVAVGGNTGNTAAKLTVNVWGGADQIGDAKDHSLRFSFNGDPVAAKQFDGLKLASIQANLTDVREGKNVVNMTLPLDTGYGFDVVQLDEIVVEYPSKFVAENNRLQFESTFAKFRIFGFSPAQLSNGQDDLVVVRRDAGGTTMMMRKRVACRAGGCAVEVAGTGNPATYFLSTQASAHKPEIAPLPLASDVRRGLAHYLIISHPDFIGADGNNLLEGLATELRSELGSADVVNVESIYAEFGDHLFDPKAIQDYIRYAYTHRNTRYVLLVGGDVYDYRQFENQDAQSFIPSLYAATGSNITFAPVDSQYADINGDQIQDLAISRLPVRTVGQLASLMQKRADYLARSYVGTALLVADHYDDVQQYDFSHDAESIAQDYLQGYTLQKAYADELGTSAARAKVRAQIEAGTSLTAFFGHSSTNQWSFNGLFTGPDAAALSNQGKPTVVTQWGCWNAYHVSPNEDSMGHRFMMEGDRGAVAVMGASTLTNADNERALASLVFEELSKGKRLGDAVTSAKQAYALQYGRDLDVLLGWTILGFPELHIN